MSEIIAPTGLSATPMQWSFKHLVVALVISFVLQSLFLPCLCDLGKAKIDFALIIDFLVVVRAGIAYLAHERGNGWRFYAGLLYTSTCWIELAAECVFGKH